MIIRLEYRYFKFVKPNQNEKIYQIYLKKYKEANKTNKKTGETKEKVKETKI